METPKTACWKMANIGDRGGKRPNIMTFAY